MGRLPLSVKTILTHLLSYLFNYIVIYGVFYAPTVLQSYPPTAALGDALAKYYAWIGERNNLLRALTSGSFLGVVFLLCWVAHDVYVYVAKKTTRASPALEDGTAPSSGPDSRPTALWVQVALATAPTRAVAAGILVLNVLSGVICGGMFIFGVSEAGVFSLRRPLLDNIRVTVQYIAGGLKLILGPAMLMAFLVWVGRTTTKAAKEKATKTAQTGGTSALPEGEKPYTDEETV
ncbi:hypothetical protein MVEN_01427100 [Mycena venus]|uniref:Uncharacterized protein n=1 Tax=Mycena venus TaxID=2733690 RepID=A0A8H6XZ78_9AGAR|nr:hypothetical protein MVEN_01427100 [Mycena venus]